MPPKRAREDPSTTEKANPPNAAMAQAFSDLARYSLKAGDAWPGKSFMKVHDVLLRHPNAITSGKQAAGLDGIGKASSDKIDEFLATGKIHKLEDLRATYGELAPMAAKAAVKKTGGGITPAQKKQIKKEEENACELSVDTLKALLRANRQKTTGTKGELAERVAEGIVLGATPTCPECSAGKLRFDMKTGVYSCPGYMDDDTFKPCYFSSTDVTRAPWKSTEENA